MENGQGMGYWASGNRYLECALVSLQQVIRLLLFTHSSHGLVSTVNKLSIFGTWIQGFSATNKGTYILP